MGYITLDDRLGLIAERLYNQRYRYANDEFWALTRGKPQLKYYVKAFYDNFHGLANLTVAKQQGVDDRSRETFWKLFYTLWL